MATGSDLISSSYVEQESSSSSSDVEQEPSRKRAFVEIYNGEEAEAQEQMVDNDKVLHVVRPMLHEPKKLRLTDNSEARQKISSTFKNQIMQRMWEAGYSKNGIEQLFSILPHGLQDAIAQGLHALQTLAHLKEHFATLRGSTSPSSATALAPTTADQPDTSPHSETLIVNDMYDSLGCGWWCLSYDPVTGRRTCLEVNMHLAQMVQMHPEELLARAGHSDVGLPCSQLEFLCNTLDELCNAGESRLVRYTAVTVQKRGRVQETMLVRHESSSDYDSAGHILRVQHFMTRVSEEEYDAAFRSDPSICRPFYSVMGDSRSGADVIADAARDFLFNEQIGSMQETVEGAKKLRRLEACLRIRFEPILQLAEKARMKLAAVMGQQRPVELANASGLNTWCGVYGKNTLRQAASAVAPSWATQVN